MNCVDDMNDKSELKYIDDNNDKTVLTYTDDMNEVNPDDWPKLMKLLGHFSDVEEDDGPEIESFI